MGSVPQNTLGIFLSAPIIIIRYCQHSKLAYLKAIKVEETRSNETTITVSGSG